MKHPIDIFSTLLMSVFNNKGVYALLLGSGISVPAKVMSGWKVTEDLIKKLATVQGETIANDAFQWFKAKYGCDAEYSKLLEQLGHKASEMESLLRPYFEPSEEDIELGYKKPTVAHKAIAEMAKRGYFKVIITTNFDRLIETALDAIGVRYQVICHESEIDSRVPLYHHPLTLLKINGDYKDCRFRNTEKELSTYPKDLEDYLDAILKNFGIITCGWSATWDKALVGHITNNFNHRYSYFYTYLDDLSDEISELASKSKGETLQIDNADIFFTEMNERLKALEIINGKNMEIDRQIAITRVKEYIVKDEDIIRYTDLFENETSKAINKICEVTYSHETMTAQLYDQIYRNAYSHVAILLDMGIVASRWAVDEIHQQVIVNALSNLANRPIDKTNLIMQEHSFKQNHAIDTVFLYGMGIACIYYRNFQLLDKILRVKLDDTAMMLSDYLIDVTNSWIIDKEQWNRTVTYERMKTPFSWVMSNLLRSSFGFIKDKEYDACFCIFEKIIAMYYYMLISSVNEYYVKTAPLGQFAWMSIYYSRDKHNKYSAFFEEIEGLKDNAPQLKGGLFENSYQKYKEILVEVDKIEKQAWASML